MSDVAFLPEAPPETPIDPDPQGRFSGFSLTQSDWRVVAVVVAVIYGVMFALNRLLAGSDSAVAKLYSTLFTVATGIGGFVLVVAILYALVSLMPELWRERGRIAVFVGPALVLLIGGLIIPSLVTGRFALYTGTAADKWYGLGNFRDLFTKRENLLVLRNNIWWVILVTSFSTVVGITVARFADRMRGEPIAKALIFLPTAISGVGAGVIWRFVYANNPSKQYGLLNYIWVGLDDVLPGKQTPQFWLQETTFFGIESSFLPGSNTVFMIIVLVWIQAGFATVVLSAAMKGVPDDLAEAARIDGATDRQAYFRVVLPYIKTTIITVVTTTVIAVLKVFDIVQAMGLGGGFENNVLANEMYTKSFTQQNEGYGSALAVVLFIAVIPVVWVNARNQRAMREARS